MPKPKKLTRTLANKGLIHPPPWLPDNMMLEGLTGSWDTICHNNLDCTCYRWRIQVCNPKTR